MTLKKNLIFGILSMAIGATGPAWVLADSSAADASNDKASNPNPTYSAGASNNSGPVDPNQPKTVPSGKSHRTHKKHGTKAESADAQKAIKAGDVTPSN